MKKILASLASLAIIGSSVTSVVSCGPITFAKLMARRVATDTYYGTYKTPITNWSTAVSMQLEDAIILTNAEDTLLATDQHNNFEGDLADKWTVNADSTAWSFHVRDNQFAGHWTSLEQDGTQKNEGIIKPTDFFNTFRFVFNPNNMSQVVGGWQSALKYADELNDFIKNIRDAGSDGSDGTAPRPPHELYDPLFTKQQQNDAGNYLSSYFIDRAILAFNLTPEDPKIAQKAALDNNGYSDEKLLADSFANGKIMNDGHESGENYNLTYNLKKPISYFKSFAAFLSFAPIPDVAVDYHNSRWAGQHYGAASGGGTFGYQNIWYSGAYVVNSYSPTLKIGMVQNKYYFNKDRISVKKLNYAYIGNVDASRQRKYFETGDISEIAVQPTDLSGWNKYVGPDYKNPEFQGANLVSRPQASTYGLMFNYNAILDNAKAASDANIAVAQRSTRAFIRYVFNRSKVASFYSKAMDQGTTSTTLRNTWTSKNVSVYKDPTGSKPDKDYVEYLQTDYYQTPIPSGSSKYQELNSESVTDWLIEALTSKFDLKVDQVNSWNERFSKATGGESALIDGNDAYLDNDLLGALAFTNTDRLTDPSQLQSKNGNDARFQNYVNLIGQYDQTSETTKINLMKEEVDADLTKFGVQSANLTWLTDGSQTSGFNNYVKDGVRTFNQAVGSNSPIRMEVVESSDTNDYSTKRQNGVFSLISSGWVPDYDDPYNYLHTIVAEGDLSIYTGFGRLFTRDTDGQLVVKPDIPNHEAYEDLKQKVQYFSDKLEEIDQTVTETNERYTKMAQLENYGVIETEILEPLLLQTLDNPPFMSYINPFTRSTFTSGQAIYRFIGVQMLPQLWNHETYAKNQEIYNAEAVDYTSIYPDENGKLKEHFNGVWNPEGLKN